jgi:RNA-directed DNA polymerase
MPKIQLKNSFEEIVSVENLLQAWEEFEVGKKNRKDVQDFSVFLMDNIFSLHDQLIKHTYKHSGYQAFKINDPKARDIHKASVRDRLLHHAAYRILYPFFDKTFISDSYSCRLNKGTHKALNRFREFGWKVSKNNTKACWLLKCDIRKFFASIDHKILKNILASYIEDRNVFDLFENVIDSFHEKDKNGVGLPLGNLTSQLLVNIYMNEFDQFVKHKLKTKYYLRYADDFVFFSQDKKELENLIHAAADFLQSKLRLTLHPGKVFIETLSSGVDFLGWVHFSRHMTLRTATRKRMFRKLKESAKEGSLQSYLGMLEHGNEYSLSEKLKALHLGA